MLMTSSRLRLTSQRRSPQLRAPPRLRLGKGGELRDSSRTVRRPGAVAPICPQADRITAELRRQAMGTEAAAKKVRDACAAWWAPPLYPAPCLSRMPMKAISISVRIALVGPGDSGTPPPAPLRGATTVRGGRSTAESDLWWEEAETKVPPTGPSPRPSDLLRCAFALLSLIFRLIMMDPRQRRTVREGR